MHGHREGDLVRVGGDARQRFHDARGYGRPAEGGEVLLAPVEAAHLLFRGDLEAVDGEGFEAFLERQPEAVGAGFLAYADLRERGYYLAPAREGWLEAPRAGVDFAVFPRGSGPGDDEIAHWVRVVGEREAVAAAELGDVVLAVVDEEGEVTYLETDRPSPGGDSPDDPPDVTGSLLADRVVAWDPPSSLHAEGFYGQPLAGRAGDPAGPVQLSLVEAAHLAASGALAVEGGADAVRERGRSVEGDRFDRRLAAYSALRDAGQVPKTGFKFGADFRTYSAVESVDELGHSEALVRVTTPDARFAPRELALHVRLAGGVRKRLWYALVGDDGIDWLEVGRLTP
ncbi:MAG: tRNA-intron lyase [Halobacteriales archaeon]|nr:tRNA-intron lyase [Halobacteriales archaeon]